MKPQGLSGITKAVVLTAFYFVGGWLGKESAFASGSYALVWPPAGIALSAILLFGARYWPGVFAGALLFSVVNGLPGLGLALGTALGNTIGALVCAYLLERFVQFDARMERVRDIAGLVGFACLMGTTVNAASNAVSLGFAGRIAWEDLFNVVVEWWVPNAMAVLIVTPLILAWGTRASLEWDHSLCVEAGVCGLGLTCGTLISFNSWYVHGIESYPLAYLPYPFMVWASLRFGLRGATTGSFLVSAVAINALLHGRGPFVAPVERESLNLIGSYLGVVSITNLLLAAVASERRQAERRLEASERRYRGVVEDQTELVWRFRPDGALTFVNDAYCRFYQKQREELLGSNAMDSLSIEDREIPLSYFATLTPQAPVVSYDHRVSQEGGASVWHQCSVRAMFDAHGRIVEYQTVASDITRLKQTEEAIRDAEQRLRAVLDGMVDGVVVVDGAGLVVGFNPAAEWILGHRASRVLGRPVREAFGPRQWLVYEDYVQNRMRSEHNRIVETCAERPDGIELPVDMAITEVTQGGLPLLVVVVRDIFDRKKLEEQFRQSQKMEAVGRLAGGIAHDFNNLMQAIIGYTTLLLRRTGADDPQRNTILQIEESATRAASLTGQLLAFSRKQVVQPKVLSLPVVVADMHRLLQRLIGENIRLVNKPSAQPVFVKADPGQLSQVIMNLAINARDAMASEGTLTIETGFVNLEDRLDGFSDDFRPGPYALLSVSDTGCGMSEEVKSHLFEPFFTTKEVGKGTGLGLSIVYGAVKQSGGQIVVVSEVGAGTEFRIYLPREEHAEEPERVLEAVPQGSHGAGGTVLLVEDEELVRTMLAEVLREDGYHVLEASHGDEALRVAAAHTDGIDLLVTDLTMPHMGGRELAERLRGARAELLVLFVSGYAEARLGQLEGKAGRSHFLPKPFRPEIFLAKVREMLAVQG